MAGKTKPGRLKWGSVRVKPNMENPDHLEASYKTPAGAGAQFPEWKTVRKDGRIPARVTATFPLDCKGEAYKWLEDAHNALKAGIWVPPDLKKAKTETVTVTFGEYAEYYRTHHRKPNGEPVKGSTMTKTMERTRNHLLGFFGDMPMTAITPQTVQQWWDTYDTKHAPDAAGGRYYAYVTLKSIMTDAATEPYPGIGRPIIDRTPCTIKAVKPKKRHRTVNASPEQLAALADAMDRMHPGIGITAWILGRLGLRLGETLALQRKDIDLEHGVLHVRRTLTQEYDNRTGRTVTTVGTPKSLNSAAPVRFGGHMAELFEEHLREHVGPEPDAWLFPTKRGTTMTEANYRDRYFNPAKRTVPGLEDYWPHDGRHTAGAYLMDNGASPNMVKKQLRHSDVRMTNKYLDTTDEQQARQIIDRVDAGIPVTPSPTPASATRDRDGGHDTTREVGGGREPVSDAGVNVDAAVDVEALADMLTGMDAGMRAAMLNGVDAGTVSRVLAAMPPGPRLETITALHRKAGQ